MLHSLEDKLEMKVDIPIQEWTAIEFEKAGISVSVLREDMNHPFIQGNKWHKLKAFILKAIREEKSGFTSIGGAYSNHLQAIAWAAHRLGKKSLFRIRGEETEWAANEAIINLRSLSAELLPISRSDFRSLYSQQEIIPCHISEHPHFQWVPMGGSSSESIPFIAEWARQIRERVDFDVVVLPAATAGTAAGFSVGLRPDQRIIAIEVLRSQGSLNRDTTRMMTESGFPSQARISWTPDYDFGGYARKSEDLMRFCTRVNSDSGFQLEPVYSGKVFWAVSDLAQKGYFPEESRILVVHTGGLFPWTIQSNPAF